MNDCGVFVCEYALRLTKNKPFDFQQEDIPNIRKRMKQELCKENIFNLDQ